MALSGGHRLVVLDLGGVLIDWQPEPAIAAGVGADEAARVLADFDFNGWNRLQDAGRTFEDALVAAERDHPEWLPHLTAYVDHYPRSLAGEVAGTAALLPRLKDAGHTLWALTNWPPDAFHHARERYPFLALFDDVLVSGDLGLAKPDPAIFALLLERVDAEPGEVFFTDDSAANVAAAQEAGVDAVRFTDAATLERDLTDRGLL